MGIQSSINSALGTVASAGAIKKYIGGQEKIAKNVNNIETKKIDEELNALQGAENVANKELFEADADINDTEVDAMKTIDDYYTAQENGKMTDKQAYDKALQTYRDKIQSIQRQLQGSIEWKKQIEDRRNQLQSRKNDIEKMI